MICRRDLRSGSILCQEERAGLKEVCGSIFTPGRTSGAELGRIVMGRAKIAIKTIPKASKRHITYGKRGPGLLKKAYELSTLCDVDILTIMFSPSGKLILQCLPETKIESVLQRFMNTPEEERTKRRNENLKLQAKFKCPLNAEKEGEDPTMPAVGVWKPAERNKLGANQHEINHLRSCIKSCIGQAQAQSQPLENLIWAKVVRSGSNTELDQLEDFIKSRLSKVMERKIFMECLNSSKAFMECFNSSSNSVDTFSSQILPMTMSTDNSFVEQMQPSHLQAQRPSDLQTQVIVGEHLRVEEEHLVDVGQASRASDIECSAWSDADFQSFLSTFSI